MSKPTPTLGYASRTEAALALKAKGLNNVAIAERMGVSRSAVYNLLAYAGDRRQTPARQVPSETSSALRSGIMLSHEAARPAHRPTTDNAVRIVEVRLPGTQFGKLVEMARKAHRTPSAYATDLFQAAYSARCAPTGDRDLDEAVARLGTPEAASGPMIDALHAELERVRAELARAEESIDELVAEVDRLSAAPAALDRATETEIELVRALADEQAKDAERWKAMAAALGQQLETAMAAREQAARSAAVNAGAQESLDALHEELQVLGDEFGVEPGTERIAGLRHVLSTMNSALAAEAAKSRDAAANIRLKDARMEALARQVKQVQSPDPALSVREPEARPPAEPAALSALQLRQVKSLRSAGNTVAEIAAEMGLPAALVRQALGAK